MRRAWCRCSAMAVERRDRPSERAARSRRAQSTADPFGSEVSVGPDRVIRVASLVRVIAQQVELAHRGEAVRREVVEPRPARWRSRFAILRAADGARSGRPSIDRSRRGHLPAGRPSSDPTRPTSVGTRHRWPRSRRPARTSRTHVGSRRSPGPGRRPHDTPPRGRRPHRHCDHAAIRRPPPCSDRSPPDPHGPRCSSMDWHGPLLLFLRRHRQAMRGTLDACCSLNSPRRPVATAATSKRSEKISLFAAVFERVRRCTRSRPRSSFAMGETLQGRIGVGWATIRDVRPAPATVRRRSRSRDVARHDRRPGRCVRLRFGRTTT